MKSKKVLLGSSFAILFSFFGGVLTGSPALGADVTVCKTGGCDYTVIQTAINAVSAAGGGTVTVQDSSTYDELIAMKDGVDVVSDPYKAHIRRSSGSGRYQVVTFLGEMTCDLKGFEISNLVRGAGIFMTGSGAGITATIEDCDVHDCDAGAGIRLDGLVSVTVTGCNLYGNDRPGIATENMGTTVDELATGSTVTVTGGTLGGEGAGNGKAGIYLWGGSGTTIQVTIGGSTAGDGNIISHNVEAGIRLENIDRVRIENNNIYNNLEAGIVLIDGSTVAPHIKNNKIYNHIGEAGINIGGASEVTIGTGNEVYGNRAGIVFYVSTNSRLSGNAISEAVTITGNQIHENTSAGVAVIDNASGTIRIDDNKIYENTLSGVAVFNKCTAEITDNEIYTHAGAAGIFTGTWSGLPPQGGTAFNRANGPATLTIRRNKVYGNRAGMRLDHASGTIWNNLVYENSRGGIRFGGDNYGTIAPSGWPSWGITQIVNNTVADNGSYVDDPAEGISEDRGGGIEYNDINTTVDPITGLTRYFYDRPVCTTQNPVTIKNNVVANNKRGGIKFCADNSCDDRSYNLYYNNFQEDCTAGNCGRMCRCKTLGYCYASGINCCSEVSWADVASFPGTWATGEICGQDPLFNADYTVQATSPAIDAGDPDPAYNDDIDDRNDMGAFGGPDPILW